MISKEIELLNSYLIKNIGSGMKIIEENVLENIKLPLILKRRYPSAFVKFMDYNCLLLFPTKNINTREFLHELQRIESRLSELINNSFNTIIILPKASKNIVSFFIENKIPFIIGNRQVYLPFIYLDIQPFEEEIEKFTPSYQLIFLYILYSPSRYVFNSADLALEMDLSEMTVRRALKYLEELQLIVDLGVSRMQVYSRTFNQRETFDKAKNYLINPLQDKLYFDGNEIDIESNQFYKYPLSGEMALSELTNIMYNRYDGDIIAMSSKEFKNKNNHNQLLEISSKYPFDFQNTFSLELWRYDPKILSKICYPNTNCVDVVSLWLTLKDIYDERIQKELEFLLNDYFDKE